VNLSRRDLGLLLAAVRASAQQPAAVATMTSTVYDTDKIPYKGDDKKKGRQFFLSATHTGFKVEMHETILGPGMETHPVHQHENEEIIIVMEGAFEANMDGKKTVMQPGSALVFGSNQPHNARNVGTTRCRYYVIELRGSEA